MPRRPRDFVRRLKARPSGRGNQFPARREILNTRDVLEAPLAVRILRIFRDRPLAFADRDVIHGGTRAKDVFASGGRVLSPDDDGNVRVFRMNGVDHLFEMRPLLREHGRHADRVRPLRNAIDDGLRGQATIDNAGRVRIVDVIEPGAQRVDHRDFVPILQEGPRQIGQRQRHRHGGTDALCRKHQGAPNQKYVRHRRKYTSTKVGGLIS